MLNINPLYVFVVEPSGRVKKNSINTWETINRIPRFVSFPALSLIIVTFQISYHLKLYLECIYAAAKYSYFFQPYDVL